MSILGLMSGSSLDGIDMALCDFSGIGAGMSREIVRTEFFPMPDTWKIRLANLPQASASELALADFEFGYFLGEICRNLFGNEPVDYIASHGHTVFHDPEKGMSCQIGNGAAIAAKTGVSVICDFRSMDVAAGGQGAPIVACLDRLLFNDMDILMNLGGILNLSINYPDKTIAWDVCPCNQLLNYMASKSGFDFDQDGFMASRGKVRQDLLVQLSSDPYFGLKAPKTLDNSYISARFKPILNAYTGSVEDKLRTVVELIIIRVKNEILAFLPVHFGNSKLPKALVTGGGARNKFLVKQLQQSLEGVDIIVPDDILVDFKEAFLMAFLGYLRVMEQKNVLASATGAKMDTIGGCIYKAVSGNSI